MARDENKKRLQMSDAAKFAARHGLADEFRAIEELDVVESKDVTGSSRKVGGATSPK